MIGKKGFYLFVAIGIIIILIGFVAWDIFSHQEYIDAFSGATPQALEKKVPGHLSVIVKGQVKQEYRFNSRALQLMAKMRIRTPEVNSSGELMGAYIYTGIPVLYILEGVVPQKNKTDAFDRPMDMVVEFRSASNQVARFSYGELVTTDDCLPVILAYDRGPIMPASEPEKYSANKYKENIKGLKLVAPRESDTSRWLDNVTEIILETPKTPDHRLPKMEKGKKCTGGTVMCIVMCIENEKQWPASIENLPLKEIKTWFRIGHGKGIRGNHLSTVKGFPLPLYLKKNFPLSEDDNDFYIFVGCDGYRGTFSSREIFHTAAGDNLLIVESIDGEMPENGTSIAPVSDFFLDRGVWGVSYIIKVCMK